MKTSQNSTAFPGGTSSKEPACQCRFKRDGFDPWVGTVPCKGHGSSLQYSCLENPMDRGAQWATVQSQTQLKQLKCSTKLNKAYKKLVIKIATTMDFIWCYSG